MLLFDKIVLGRVRNLVKLNAEKFILSHEYPHRDVCATYHLPHWWHRWGEMQQLVYQVHDVDELKQRLIDVWYFWPKCHQCVKMWNVEHLIWLHIMHILLCVSYLLILWILKKSYCVTCSRILPVSVFRVLQGSGVTPLKCDEKYDTSFVAHFMENTRVKRFWKSVNIYQTYERMYSGTVFFLIFIEARCGFRQ